LDDLGGEAHASAAQFALAKRAATLEIELERMEATLSSGGSIDLEVFNRISGGLRRLLETLGAGCVGKREHRKDGPHTLGQIVKALVDRNIVARSPVTGNHYVAGCDASGGRNDSFTAAISHRERDGSVVLDVLFERKAPFNPNEVVSEVTALMKQYGVRQITGDNYGAQWTVSAFAAAGVTYSALAA
jgi:hypothetical protein